MIPTKPVISIIIPTKNRASLLAVALESVQKQTFQSFEVIVVNDGGEDVTALVESFKTSFPVTLVTHLQSKGLSGARNSGLDVSRGRYICYLDDDDIYYPQHLEVLIKSAGISKLPVVYTVGVLAIVVEMDTGHVLGTKNVALAQKFSRKALAEGNITPVLAVMHEKKCLEKTGPFAESLRGHEDWDLWQRMARFYDFSLTQEETCEYYLRVGKTSLSSNVPAMRETWLAIRRQGELLKNLPNLIELKKIALKALLARYDSPPSPSESAFVPFASVVANAESTYPVSVLTELSVTDRSVLQHAKAVLQAAQGHEVIFIYNGSVESCELLMHTLLAGKSAPVQVICLPESGIGQVLAYNLGARASRGRLLLFLEAGVVLSQKSLQKLLDAAIACKPIEDDGRKQHTPCDALHAGKHPSQTGLWSPVIIDNAGKKRFGGSLTPEGELVFNDHLPAENENNGPTLCLSSLCMMVTKEAFVAADGFDTAYIPNYYADADLCMRLAKKHIYASIVPDAVALWEQGTEQASQSPAAIMSRRTFWERYAPRPFDFDTMLQGAEWGARTVHTPADGQMPENFDFDIPESYR